MKRLAIIVPCYNEEEVFSDTNTVLNNVLKDLIEKKKVSSNSFILYIDDGSKDATWSLIENEYNDNKLVYGLKFTGNKGHQNAVYAGLMYGKDNSDLTITIDADLQDDVNVIEEMVDKYNDGAHVVYGVRNNRDSDSFFKKMSANMFYNFIKRNGSKAVNNAADFRLLSKEVIEELSLYNEFHLYLRGLIPDLGYRQECVYYKRLERKKGESKYPLSKMIRLAIDGVTACNDSPLFNFYFLSFASFIVAILSFALFVIQNYYMKSLNYVYFLFGFVFIAFSFVFYGLATLGQYIGRTYIESKKRPRYFVEKILDHKKKEK